jgi:hypothetical protein
MNFSLIYSVVLKKTLINLSNWKFIDYLPFCSQEFTGSGDAFGNVLSKADYGRQLKQFPHLFLFR